MGERSRVRTWLRRIWVVGGISFTAWLAWNLQSRGVAASSLASTSNDRDHGRIGPASPSIHRPVATVTQASVRPMRP